MIDLKGQEGELRFTVEVKRAATGEVQTFEMVGKIGDSQEVEIEGNSHECGQSK